MRFNWRGVLQTTFALLLMVLGAFFFYRNRGEVHKVAEAFRQAEPGYLVLAVLGVIITIVEQSYAIKLSYEAIEKKIPIRETISLYLKRFFLSPFIPGGFSVAQYTLTKDLAHHDITPAEHAFVSSGYVVAGIVSYLIILIPVIYLLSGTFFHGTGTIYVLARGLAGLVVVGAVLGFLFRNFLSKLLRRWLQPHIGHFHTAPLVKATLTSLIVDTSGILVLWSSVHSLGVNLPVGVAAGAYILAILVLTISPLFQGLLVVEGVLTFFLGQAGVPAGEALASVLIFRGFQLWLPLLIGGVVYASPLVLSLKERLGFD
jgi:uncharacterized membrane protein YbhN (UPF0104 family)